MNPASPTFQLEIYLVKGPLKKQGGEVNVDLRNFPINASNRISASIEKSPLQNAILELDFVFMKS